MSDAPLQTILLWATPGYFIGMFLPPRLFKWMMLLMELVAPKYAQSLAIKPTRIDRAVSWFVILLHPVPLGLVAGVAILIFRWPTHLGVAGQSFWSGVMIGSLTSVVLIVVFTLRFYKKRRVTKKTKAEPGAGQADKV